MATFCVNVIRSGFLDHRPPREDLFPLFYSTNPRNVPKFSWTPDELAFVKDLYNLWLHSAMLLFRKGIEPSEDTWKSLQFVTFIEKLSSTHLVGGEGGVGFLPFAPPYLLNLPPAPEFFVKLVGFDTPYARRVAAAMYACEIRKTKPSDKLYSVSNSTGVVGGVGGLPLTAKALPGGNRKGLSEPHMYIYSTEIPRRRISGPVLDPPSELERRYESSSGYMCRIPPEGTSISLTLPEGGIGVSIFYKVDTGTIVPIYDVMSRGFALSSDASLTTFAGPMNFNYKMDPEQFVVSRDFEYIPDYQLFFNSNGPDSRKSIILNPVEINKYSESLYEIVSRAGVTEAQSFIYRGLDVICPISVLAFLEPDCLPTEIFEASLDRMYARRGITSSHFISLLADSAEEVSNPLELKQVVIEAINLINTLVYRNDTVFGREVDVHQNIRLTNTDDCDGGAEGMFRIMQGIKTDLFKRNARRDDVRALSRFFEKVTPLFMHMRIDYAKSNSHSIAAGVVFDEKGRPDKRYQMFMMEGTGPEYANFCSIDEAKCDPDATRWRISMAKSISSPLEYYHEPCDGPWGGDRFYKGFIGAVPGHEGGYKFFAREGGGLESLTNNGVGLCEVAMEGSYELVGPALSADATAELKRLGGFSPPLPMPRGDGSFPKEYESYLERVRAAVKKNGKGGVGGLPLTAAFTMFLNLCITESEFEKALGMLGKLEGYSKAEVHGYSTFPGTAIIEINIR